jgi:general secretion pathway protein F
MLRVAYQALSPDGQITKGILEADSISSAVEALQRQGLTPFKAEPASEQKGTRLFTLGGKRPRLEWRTQFVRQAATLLSSGIPLDRTLALLESQSKEKVSKERLKRLKEAVVGGHALSAGLELARAGFQPDEVGLIKAGEQTGSLVPVLDDLAASLERRLELKGKMASAFVYPAFLLVLAPVSLGIIAMVLVPSLEPLFEASHADMPAILAILSVVSAELRNHGLLWLGLMLLLALAGAVLLRQITVQNELQSLATRLPVIRTIVRQLGASRICRSLGALLKGGASLQSAMTAVAEVTSTPASKAEVLKARDAVVSGKKLEAAMSVIKVITPETLQMIAIGEEANRLEVMLKHIADAEQKSAERYIDRLMTIATPLLTVLVGGMVGGVVMSIMGAILSLNDMAVQ